MDWNKTAKTRTGCVPCGRKKETGILLQKSRTVAVAKLNRLKNSLLEEQLAGAIDDTEQHWLRRAAEEAASLAWTTPFPLFVLPSLLEEKAQTARDQCRRQMDIANRSRNMFVLAE